MDRRTFLQLAGAVTAGQLLTTLPGIKTAQARGQGSPPGSLSDRILGTRPDALGAYWPLNEVSGNVANDLTGHGCNGVYYSAVLNQPGPGDGGPAVGFDGKTSYADVLSAAFASFWNGNAGTVHYRAKVYQQGTWDNATPRRVFYAGDTSYNNMNHVSLRKQNGPDLLVSHRWAQGLNNQLDYDLRNQTPVGWFAGVYTWDVAAGQEVFYLSLDQLGYRKLSYSGPMLSLIVPLKCALISKRPDTADGECWLGWLGRIAYWNAALTEAEVANLIPIG